MGKGEANSRNMNDKKEGTAPIELRDSFYSNGIRITYSQYEFVMDFYQQPIQDTFAFDGIRIITNPQNLKIFSQLFIEQLKNYEEKFGEIKF